MFVYHVCAQKDSKYFDGITQANKKITSYDGYLELKKDVAIKMNIENDAVITILSLSFLHEVEYV